MVILPNKLKNGDIIGIVSPSSGVAEMCPRRLKRGLEELKRLGFHVLVGKHARKRDKYMAGSIEERLEDLHNMFSNPHVKAIVTTIGGTCSHQLLDELDYDLIRRNPKIFMGYSDITALHLAIYKKTGLVTFLGPAILPQFGECGGLLDYTNYYFHETLIAGNAVQFQNSKQWIAEHLKWDEDDNRKRKTIHNSGMKVLKAGEGRGKIIAGNMGVLLLLAGTPYFPDLKGAILCVEDDENETPASIDRYFTHMRHLGVFDEIQALVIGRFHPKVGLGTENEILKEIVFRTTRGYHFPVVYDVDFGHTDPMFILANGIHAALAAKENGEISFRMLEAAVQ